MPNTALNVGIINSNICWKQKAIKSSKHTHFGFHGAYRLVENSS